MDKKLYVVLRPIGETIGIYEGHDEDDAILTLYLDIGYDGVPDDNEFVAREATADDIRTYAPYDEIAWRDEVHRRHEEGLRMRRERAAAGKR